MKRSTAIGHLVRLAEEATENRERFGEDRLPLAEMWATGPILDPGVDSLDTVTVVFSLDLPVAAVPWRSRPPAADQLTFFHRLDKIPVWPLWRPVAWPAWNAEFRRVARFWSVDDGIDGGVIERLRAAEAVGIEPEPEAFEAQMRVELEVTRRHLDAAVDGYYDRAWQKAHRGDGLYPGDHLWWAAAGYREIEQALAGDTTAVAGSGSETVHRLKITLRDVEPPVWRRVLVRSDAGLDEVAWTLIRAMGWGGAHLHLFDVDGISYGMADPDAPADELDEAQYRLSDVLAEPGVMLQFDYDFGDGWTHDVEVEAIEPMPGDRLVPAVLAGQRACPPDDCGGPHGYEEISALAVDPARPDPNELRDWMPPGFDPERFVVSDADVRIREPLPRW